MHRVEGSFSGSRTFPSAFRIADALGSRDLKRAGMGFSKGFSIANNAVGSGNSKNRSAELLRGEKSMNKMEKVAYFLSL